MNYDELWDKKYTELALSGIDLDQAECDASDYIEELKASKGTYPKCSCGKESAKEVDEVKEGHSYKVYKCKECLQKKVKLAPKWTYYGNIL